MICVFHRLENVIEENILEKGENAGNQHFLLFPKYFLKIARTWDCVVQG